MRISPIVVGSAVSVLVVAGLITYGVLHRSAATPPIDVTATTTPVIAVPVGSKLYENAAYHFRLFYPEELAVNEFHEPNGNLTVTFKKEDGSNGGFQVFVTPYAESYVTAERFKKDVPTGVKKDEQAFTVDGVSGNAFLSTNTAIGESREIWFINSGFLYEVTTYKELDSWLQEIMQSWKFE